MDKIKGFFESIMDDSVTKFTTCLADFGINCIFAWLPFYLSPGVFTCLVSLILTFAFFSISFSVADISEKAAKFGGLIAYTVLALMILCTATISTVGLNVVMRMIDFNTDLARLDIWFIQISGETMSGFVILFAAFMLTLINGVRPFMKGKTEGK